MRGRTVLGLTVALLALAVAAAVGLAHGHHASTLGKAKHYPVDGPDQLRQVAVGDMNGDGRNDIVVSDNFNQNAWVLQGTKHGFKAATKVPIGNVSHALALGDLNHDGLPDIVSGGSSSITATTNGADTIATFGFASSDVAIADVNHDHNPDIVASGANTDYVAVVLGTHSGVGGGSVEAFPTPSQPVRVAVAKVDGNKNPDLIVLENDDLVGAVVQVMHGDGHGGFTGGTSLIFSHKGAESMVAGNFNGDHHPDVALIQGCLIGQPHKVLLSLGTKDGSFSAPRSVKAPPEICAEEPAAADVNGDGNLDVLAADHNGNLDVFYGNGKGRLSKAKELPAVSSAQSVAVGKLNGDRRPDVVVPDTNPTKVAVLYGKRR